MLVPVTGMNRDYLAMVLANYGKAGGAPEGAAPDRRKAWAEGKAA